MLKIYCSPAVRIFVIYVYMYFIYILRSLSYKRYTPFDSFSMRTGYDKQQKLAQLTTQNAHTRLRTHKDSVTRTHT